MLTVDYTQCDSNSRLWKSTDDQYRLGIYLQVLGVNRLTAANIADAKLRLKYYLRVTDQNQYYHDTAELFDDSIGVKVNTAPATWAQFSARLLRDFRSRYGS